MVWHVDKYKITFKLVINHWTNEILQHILVSSGQHLGLSFSTHSWKIFSSEYIHYKMLIHEKFLENFFFDGATAQGGPWSPLQWASKPILPLLCPSIRLFPSFWGLWTRHPTISFLVFLFVLLHTIFYATSFLELQCLALFLYDQAIIFFCIL